MRRARFLFVLTVIACASIHVARSQPPSTDDDSGVVSLLQDALRSRVSFGHDKQGNDVFAYHCRRAAEGCNKRLNEFAHYLVDAGHAYGIDPWLMAAMAFKESGLNPYAKGPAGEMGILQIHPKRRDARQVRFMRDEWYRLRCRRQPGACQEEIVKHAARVLARSLELCGGNLKQALGAYNTGRCGGSRKYAKRILTEREWLLRKVGLEEQAAQIPDATEPSRS